ncbi:MAG: hypothetical protein J6T88_01775 [Bacteroidales bacterium]|nr:hypothetical protein [Bacteroidales bacterium]
MRKIIYLCFLLISQDAISQNISVMFSPESKRDKYCSQISLPYGHCPNEYINPGPGRVWFCYPDSSICFYTRGFWTPFGKCWQGSNNVLDQLSVESHETQISPLGDTIYVYYFYGEDTNGNLWKEKIFVDSRYFNQNGYINTWWYISAIGYCNVRYSNKEIFESIINSFVLKASSEYERDPISKYRHFTYINHNDNIEYLITNEHIDLVSIASMVSCK